MSAKLKAPQIMEAYNKERRDGGGDGDNKKIIGYLLELEKYAEGDEKIALHLGIAQRYRDSGDHENAIKYFNLVAEEAAQGYLLGETSGEDGTIVILNQEEARQALRVDMTNDMKNIFKDIYTLSALLEKEKEITGYPKVALQLALTEIYRDKGECEKATEYYNSLIDPEGIKNIQDMTEVSSCQKKLEEK